MSPPQIDVGKLVGAASAPVALIIATSIFLGNLGGKYSMLAGIFRELSNEYRTMETREEYHGKRLHRQMQVYTRRLRLLMRATFWLTISILCFIMTVFLTGLAVMFPKTPAWTWATALFSFAGLLILGASVGIEIFENYLAREAMRLEAAEFPDILDRTDLRESARRRSTEVGS